MQGVKGSLEHMEFTYLDAHEAGSMNVGEWHVAMLLPIVAGGHNLRCFCVLLWH